MTFEEAKKLLLESVDEARNLNDLLHTVVDKIYLKGYEDGLRMALHAYERNGLL